MMTFEALFSLLALLIVIAMLAQPEAQCAGDAVYGQRLAQDAASVLAKKGALDGFANWVKGEHGTAGYFENDLHGIAELSGKCVGISMDGKNAFSCADGIGGGREEGDVYSVGRIVVLKNGFARVRVAVWKGGQ